MPGKVFLNYRRKDSAAWADRIHERLKAQLPQADIFLDIDGKIPLGVPWEEWVDSEVATCDLMLALIGDRWIEEFQKRSNSEERDFVRVEIASALARIFRSCPFSSMTRQCRVRPACLDRSADCSSFKPHACNAPALTQTLEL